MGAGSATSCRCMSTSLGEDAVHATRAGTARDALHGALHRCRLIPVFARISARGPTDLRREIFSGCSTALMACMLRRVSGPNAVAPASRRSAKASTWRSGVRTSQPSSGFGSTLCSRHHRPSRAIGAPAPRRGAGGRSDRRRMASAGCARRSRPRTSPFRHAYCSRVLLIANHSARPRTRSTSPATPDRISIAAVRCAVRGG